MLVTTLFGLGLLSGLGAPPAHADFTFGKPVNTQSVLPILDPPREYITCCSSDGLEIYIDSDRAGGYGGIDLWVLRRSSIDADWGPPENLGPAVNTTREEAAASISADGLTLYFNTNWPGGQGSYDIYMTTRATRNDPWGQPTNLGPKVNSPQLDSHASISPDGLELYFISGRPGGYGSNDIYVSRRATTSDPWGDPVNLGPVVNDPYNVAAPHLSPDGLLLFFQDVFGSTPRPGGYGGCDIWMARRATVSSPWQMPVNPGPAINSAGHELGGIISPDGSTLYFMNYVGGVFGNWQAPILPVVDFNADGKVDAKDLALLVANWGKNASLCDIGPFAWGDGIVDERDLRVLMESLMTPGPKASDVPCDVVLSWIAPSFANTCDVYLGTSQEAVNTASRTNPRGVLVSQGQTATAYRPADPLEFSRTYYWRVDFVISGPTPAIYQGPVLKFTTAASVYPIKNVTANASSMQAESGPEKTVDGSGLDKNNGHSTDAKDMWWSQGVPPNWIQYEFDRIYALHELWVWNFNTMIEPFMGFGAKTVKIEYSTDGTTWTPLADVPEFKKASGKPGYVHDTTISFGGVSAKFVKLTIEKNWGVAPQTGLSEVRFFAIQSTAAAKPEKSLNL